MSYRLVPTKNYALVRSLEDQILPNEGFEGPEDGNVYWIARNHNGVPVAYCSIRPSHFDPTETAFLSRAGVLPSSRGKGLQRRMIRVRLAWARRKGYKRVITYATRYNVPSLRNLIREGFEPFWPDLIGLGDWAGADTVYLMKILEGQTPL